MACVARIFIRQEIHDTRPFLKIGEDIVCGAWEDGSGTIIMGLIADIVINKFNII